MLQQKTPGFILNNGIFTFNISTQRSISILKAVWGMQISTRAVSFLILSNIVGASNNVSPAGVIRRSQNFLHHRPALSYSTQIRTLKTVFQVGLTQQLGSEQGCLHPFGIYFKSFWKKEKKIIVALWHKSAQPLFTTTSNPSFLRKCSWVYEVIRFYLLPIEIYRDELC